MTYGVGMTENLSPIVSQPRNTIDRVRTTSHHLC